MTTFTARIDGTRRPLPKPAICDAWLADGQRLGDELPSMAPGDVLGRWPDELDTDAVVRLAETVGDERTWALCAETPPVAQKLAERARLQPLDLQIMQHLRHLRHVCYKPRIHLRVEEERLPVSRARRTPVRAVAELVSHPGDWEHRTLRSIQPSRVLARQIEDEWNIYENRVAVRLVDHLLTYLAKRLEELRKIKVSLETSDYSKDIRGTSYRRAGRISKLWSTTLESKTEAELSRAIKGLELAQRDLQTLLDAPLYLHIPRRESVALVLRPTNILVNDSNYRKVAALWRAWVKFGHKRHETVTQHRARRQREAVAWDQFVLHLVARAFTSLGWKASEREEGWQLSKNGWHNVDVTVSADGVVRVAGERALRLLPLCTDLSSADGEAVLQQVEALDSAQNEVVLVHVGRTASVSDADRASGWSFGGRAVLFACSPWSIDSEERMTRLLHGWLGRTAVPIYPIATLIPDLPDWSAQWDWLRYEDGYLVAFREPKEHELAEALEWSRTKLEEFDAKVQRVKGVKPAFSQAQSQSVADFGQFVERAAGALTGLDRCPVCGGQGDLEPRPGKFANGSDATWWVSCSDCKSKWGTRPCTKCRYRNPVLIVGDTGVDVANTAPHIPILEWPDRVLGRDVWAQPCAEAPLDRFRCAECGSCSNASCGRCARRIQSILRQSR